MVSKSSSKPKDHSSDPFVGPIKARTSSAFEPFSLAHLGPTLYCLALESAVASASRFSSPAVETFETKNQQKCRQKPTWYSIRSHFKIFYKGLWKLILFYSQILHVLVTDSIPQTGKHIKAQEQMRIFGSWFIWDLMRSVWLYKFHQRQEYDTAHIQVVFAESHSIWTQGLMINVCIGRVTTFQNNCYFGSNCVCHLYYTKNRTKCASITKKCKKSQKNVACLTQIVVTVISFPFAPSNHWEV